MIKESVLLKKPENVRAEFLPFGKPNFSEEEISAVTRVLNSGWVGMGQETLAFEQELACYLNVSHVVTVNSCTSALFLSLLIHGIGEGDEVICPSLTWCSTANVALYLGAKPVLCDIDPDSLCVTPELVLEKLTPKTKAVIVVHMGGLSVDVEQMRHVLPKHVTIIEDAAHALGAKYRNGIPVGSSENPTCFSFYANKNLSTGEGGAIALFDDALAERIKKLRQHGLSSNAWERFIDPKVPISRGLNELGYKMNYTDLQASIGRVQLKRQTVFSDIRLDIARYYHDALNQRIPGIRYQDEVLNFHHARHLFVIQLPIETMILSRNEVLSRLRDFNIGACVHYLPLHQMPLFSSETSSLFPNTQFVAERMLTLPISASMDLKDAEYVVDQLEKIIRI